MIYSLLLCLAEVSTLSPKYIIVCKQLYRNCISEVEGKEDYFENEKGKKVKKNKKNGNIDD